MHLLNTVGSMEHNGDEMGLATLQFWAVDQPSPSEPKATWVPQKGNFPFEHDLRL